MGSIAIPSCPRLMIVSLALKNEMTIGVQQPPLPTCLAAVASTRSSEWSSTRPQPNFTTSVAMIPTIVALIPSRRGAHNRLVTRRTLDIDNSASKAG